MKTQKDYLDTILDDNEKLAIAQFVESDVMREAVKKVLLVGIYGNGTLEKGKPANPLLNFAIGYVFNRPEATNEELGADLRATASGINSLEVAFNQLERFRREPERSPKPKNQAR